MKTLQQNTLLKSHPVRLALGTVLLLMIPFVLTLTGSGVEGDGWFWTPRDFVFAFVMIFGTGLAIDYAIKRFKTPLHRVISVGGIFLAFLLIWVELAVGIFD
jgi:hypothetical protein